MNYFLFYCPPYVQSAYAVENRFYQGNLQPRTTLAHPAICIGPVRMSTISRIILKTLFYTTSSSKCKRLGGLHWSTRFTRIRLTLSAYDGSLWIRSRSVRKKLGSVGKVETHIFTLFLGLINVSLIFIFMFKKQQITKT